MLLYLEKIKEQTEKLRSQKILKWLFGIALDLGAFLEDENRSQLWQGLRSDGTEIEPPYTAFTEFLKVQAGQPIDRVTLKDTGAFYDSIEAIASAVNEITLQASDSKTSDLKEKYGDAIIGISQESLIDYIEFILFRAQSLIKKEII